MAAGGASRRVFELFVARVPWTASANEVKEYFSQFGTVRKCTLPFIKETGFHKGFCWVGFTTEESLKTALQKENHILEGVKGILSNMDFRESTSISKILYKNNK